MDVVSTESNVKARSLLTCTTIDISKFSSRYEGATLVERLLTISKKCENLRVEAMQQLLIYLKSGTCNFTLYDLICNELSQTEVQDPQIDKSWPAQIKNVFDQKLERLESDLNMAKSSLGKETMRLKYVDIACLYRDSGNLSEALKHFLRAKEYCSLPTQQNEIWINIIVTSIDLKQYRTLFSFIDKAESTVQNESHLDILFKSKLRAASGLTALAEGNFKQVADTFQLLDPIIRGKSKNLLSVEDIAIYTSLCAMATYERVGLQKLLENSNFKEHSEFFPLARQFIVDFIESKYTSCISLLRDYRPQFLLDIHLAPHVDKLTSLVTEKVITQYVKPYQSVDLLKMSTLIGMELDEIESLLLSQILTGRLEAKIDSTRKILKRDVKNQRDITLKKITTLARQNQTDLKRSILRLSVLQSNLVMTNDYDSGGGKYRVFLPSSTFDVLPSQTTDELGEYFDADGDSVDPVDDAMEE